MLLVRVIQTLCAIWGVVLVESSFNPFMDSELFAINWATAVDLSKDHLLGDESVVVLTKQNEKYQCIFPDSQKLLEENKKQYEGPSADELMETLFSQAACSYRIESYWTYELCHGRHLRQYHEDKEPSKKPKLQEYILGSGRHIPEKTEDESSQEGTSHKKMKYRKIDGLELPYFEVWMSDGTECDLTHQPRRSHVMYICQAEGHGEVYELKETSTCEYDVTVLTSVLCSHPDFRPKTAPVHQIQCLPLENSPPRPRQLEVIEMEEKRLSGATDTLHSSNVETGDEAEATPEPAPVPTPAPIPSKKPKVYRKQPDILGPQTDKNLVREVISGDHCLKGGGGWWKYEFCFGKYARQYHDSPEGRTIITLGQWNEDKHKEWVNENPSRRMNPVGERKFISLFLGNGDICQLTGAKRFVEVRLKCVTNTKHPHSVALYLMEPSVCEYILGIESPIFCQLLDQADDYGLLKNVNLDA